jgi:hypothetical protein
MPTSLFYRFYHRNFVWTFPPCMLQSLSTLSPLDLIIIKYYYYSKWESYERKFCRIFI